MNITTILQKYNLSDITIGVLGGHSALDVCRGANDLGFRTVAVAQKGREKTFTEAYKTRKMGNQKIGCIDEVILVDTFSDILKSEVQNQLQKLNTIFIHNRYFWVYFNDFSQVENNFQVPIFGTRDLLKLEERDIQNNQYWLLEKAGIRIPKMFEIPKLSYNKNMLSFDETESPINCLTLTKVNNAQRTYERENFVASSWEEWRDLASRKIAQGEITLEDLQKSVIEEFILGAQVNFNFFYSPLTDSLEMMGTDTRRQTNLDGWLRLPAQEQLKLKNQQPKHIETGHIAVTVKESLVEKAYIAGKAFVEATKKHAPPGIIGPFALQGAIETNGKKEELVVFDVSLRIPGSPGIAATPYSSYLYGEPISMGKRCAMEIQYALDTGNLESILT